MKYSYFSQKTNFDISSKSSHNETICIRCQSQFFWKKKKKKTSKTIIHLSSAKLAKRVVTVKCLWFQLNRRNWKHCFRSFFTKFYKLFVQPVVLIESQHEAYASNRHANKPPSTQSDQSLRCSYEETLHPCLTNCALTGLFEISLCAHTWKCIFDIAAHFHFQ